MSDTEAPSWGGVYVAADKSALWRPVMAHGLLAGVIAVIEVFVAGTGGDAAARGWFFALSVGFVLFLGLGQSASWWLRLGRIAYLIDSEGVRLRRGEDGRHSWSWAEIDTVHARGDMGWRTFLVSRGDVSSFPHLVVHSNGQRTRCPGVILWGVGRAAWLENQLSIARANANRD